MGGLPAGAKPLFGKDNLPPAADEALGGHEWELVRKATLTKVMRIDRPFAVTTIHGGPPQECLDGFLALDSQGHPYPIDLKVFEETFEDPNLPVEPAAAPDGWQGTEPAEGTRRKLIRDTIASFAVQEGSLADNSLGIADEIEERLLAVEVPVGGGEGTDPGERDRQPATASAPTLGRVVWYCEAPAKPGELPIDRAAIVLEVDDEEQCVLWVFSPSGGYCKGAVRHAERAPEEQAKMYCWRWPERTG